MWCRLPRLFLIIVHDGAPGGAVEVVELAGMERPEKGRERERSQSEGGRNEPGERAHVWKASARQGLVVNRRAFSVTAMDDVDMAIAATRGVTNPSMASGTHTAL